LIHGFEMGTDVRLRLLVHELLRGTIEDVSAPSTSIPDLTFLDFKGLEMTAAILSLLCSRLFCHAAIESIAISSKRSKPIFALDLFTNLAQ
jgi:hypothetical protein